MKTLSELAESLQVGLSDQLLFPTEEPLEIHPEAEGLDELEGIPRGKPSKGQPLGRIVFDKVGFAKYRANPLETKREYLKNQWLDLTYLLLGKATALAMTVQKKDFGRLVQILTSAGIAHDKVFPKVHDASVGNLVVNMFKGLPTDKVLRVIGGAPVPSGEPLEGKPLGTM